MIYEYFLDLKISKIGIGTYLGELTQESSKGYINVIKEGIKEGINVVDTAIVYRYEQSEKDIAKALKEIKREEVIISTKGGYLLPTFELNILTKEELMFGHSIRKEFIDYCFEKSLKNLETDYIDIYFLHNVEDALNYMSRGEFYNTLKESFSLLDHKIKEGKLKYYGVATWSGFRVKEDHKNYLNLLDLKSLGSENFKFIQLPFNIAMQEAFTLKNQNYQGKALSTLEAAKELNIYVYTSASIAQARVLTKVPLKTALCYVVNNEFVGTALIGMSKINHLRENLDTLKECTH